LSIAAFVLSQALNYAVDLTDGYATKEGYVSIFSKLDRELSDLDLRRNNVRSGNLQQFMGQNYELVKRFIFQVPIMTMINAVYIVGIIFCMAFLSLPITLVVTFSIPIFLLLSHQFEKTMTENTERTIHDMEQLKDYETDQFRLTKEERFLQIKQLKPISKLLQSYNRNMKKKVRTEAVFDNLLSFGMLNAIILISTLMSVYFVYRGQMTIGGLFAITLYTSRFWDPAEFFATIRKEYLATKPVLRSFTRFLSFPVVSYSKTPIQFLQLNRFLGLNADGEQLHQAIDWMFAPGFLHVIQGANGSGKTTLVESILGLSDRYKGEIQINGANLKVRSSDFVYVPAEPIISGYGNLSVTNGSYGQKKIAQMKHDLSTDKSVYFFDEPTNFLDMSNKAIILHLINELVTKGKIVIVISHDPLFLKQPQRSVLKIKPINQTE
jgi:ABC-type bacteriocin/lantibiotic exporter with double-glycine peptidase domain